MSQELKDIGVGITRSVEFMRTVFSEIPLVFKDIERQFQRLAIVPLDAKFVYLDDTSANLESPNAWLQASMGRLFSSGGSRPSTELVIVEVHLQPGHGLDEPVVVAAVASWPSPKPKNEASNAYSRSEWVWSLAPEQAPLEAPLAVAPTEDVLPDATRLHLAAWPMTRLTNGTDVQRTVVQAVSTFLREAT